jgi:serine/threonine-protein kinase
MDDQSKELLSGTVIQDRYRVVRLLGKGGMGEVYEVEHVRFGRRLALKRLLPQFADNAVIVDRFQREARAAAMIGNTHIIEVTDMGELPDGSPYIVLEYLDGEDL